MKALHFDHYPYTKSILSEEDQVDYFDKTLLSLF